MLLRIFTFLLLSLVAISNSLAEKKSIEELFNERAKCVVAIKYSIEMEEDRSEGITSGMIADENGLVLVTDGDIADVRADEMKDFKAYFYGGDVDGYPMEYLGEDFLTGISFLRIKGGTPKGRVPFTAFPRAKKVSVGDFVWGIGIYPKSLMFEPKFMRSYVTDIGMRPLKTAATADAISSPSSAIFDFDGNFVGWGLGEIAKFRLLDGEGIDRVPVNIISLYETSCFILPEELEEILRFIPSKPNGDSGGWLGLFNMTVLARDVAKLMGLENKLAILVGDVYKGSPADKSGIKKGDIIVGIDGKDLEQIYYDDHALFNFIRKYIRKKIGDKTTLSIIRTSDAPKTFEVQVCEAPKTYRQTKMAYFKRIGFSVREYILDDAIYRKAIDKKGNYVITKYVRPNSPAASASPNCLEKGDVIKEINSKPVSSYDEVVDELKKIDSNSSVKSLVILVENFNETKVVRIKLD